MSKHHTPAVNLADPGRNNVDRGLLALGGLGAVVASACCILPFVLVVMGLGGAWLARQARAVFDPSRTDTDALIAAIIAAIENSGFSAQLKTSDHE